MQLVGSRFIIIALAALRVSLLVVVIVIILIMVALLVILVVGVVAMLLMAVAIIIVALRMARHSERRSESCPGVSGRHLRICYNEASGTA